MRHTAIPALLLVAAVLPAADWIRVEPQVSLLTTGGDMSYADKGVAGTTFSPADVGLDSREAAPGIEIDVAPPLLPIGFNVGGYKFKTDGQADPTQGIDFGGISFPANTTVKSTLEIQDLYGEINFCPLRMGLGGASVGLAVHQLQAKAELSSTTAGTVSASETAYIPALSVRGYVSPIDAIQAEAAVQFMKLPLGDSSLGYLSAQAQVGYFPIDMLGVFAGYRYTAYDLVMVDGKNRFEGQVTLSGPYAGLEARF